MIPGILLVKGNYGLAGGPETLIASLARHLDTSRFSPRLIVIRRDGVSESPCLDPGALAVARQDVRWHGFATAFFTALRLRDIARSTGARVIHTHDMRADLVACLVRRITQIKWIAHVHGWLGRTHQSAKHRIYEEIDRRLIRYADVVIVGSGAAHEEVARAGARRVQTIPNAVEVPEAGLYESAGLSIRRQLGIPGAAVLAGTIGRVHSGKGHRYLIEAVALLRSRGSDVRCLVAGDGPELRALRSLAGALGISDAVYFPGFCADGPAHVAAMDVFVAPSLKESLPLALLEAMALARPVIASAVGDIATVISHEQNGFVVPPADAPAIASALHPLVENADLRKLMGSRARTTIESRFSAPVMSRRVEALYAQLMREQCV